MTYEQALKDFSKVAHVTYFEPTEHTEVSDLCYLCLHELDLHAEGEYWHPVAIRKQLLAFCKKYGHYVEEAQEQFNLGKDNRKEDSYI